jgi:hypothetical protein
MITYEEAKQIAQHWLNEMNTNSARSDWMFFGEPTEHSFGWIFGWSTRAHVETGNWMYAAPGNSPIIVDRCDGSIHSTGTAYPTSYYVEEYERKRTQSC